jgi:hypothetical protein
MHSHDTSFSADLEFSLSMSSGSKDIETRATITNEKFQGQSSDAAICAVAATAQVSSIQVYRQKMPNFLRQVVAARQAPSNADSPEAIVHSDNQVIRLVRSLVVLFLLLAASATVTFVYRFSLKKEEKTFGSEYEAISLTVVNSLFLALRLNFWIARTIASSVGLAIEVADLPVTNLTISDPRWEEITQESRFMGSAQLASWIPFLYSDDERLMFEAHVRESTISETDRHPDCYFCGGNPSLIFENKDEEVEISGVGFFTCRVVYNSGRTGVIPKDSCSLVQTIVEPVCRCIEPKDIDEAARFWYLNDTVTGTNSTGWSAEKGLFRFDENHTIMVPQEFDSAPYAPTCLISRVHRDPIMYNHFSDSIRARTLGALIFGRIPLISEARIRSTPYDYYSVPGSLGELVSDLYFPVFDPIDKSLVGVVLLELQWKEVLADAVASNAELLDVVMSNTCGQVFTFKVNKTSLTLVLEGESDLHDTKYDKQKRGTTTDMYAQLIDVVSNGFRNPGNATTVYCSFQFDVYPTTAFEDVYMSKEPFTFAMISTISFIFASMVFFIYDSFVRRRQHKVMVSAKRTNAIVTSLFPESVRQRMYRRISSIDSQLAMPLSNSTIIPSSLGKNSFPISTVNVFGSEPIADLFPHATVMFIDIAGFTAWSSERDATQVFTLLETLYHAFDQAGCRLGIFKVETIGDSYVAVAGLPTPRNDHAVGKLAVTGFLYFA